MPKKTLIVAVENEYGKRLGEVAAQLRSLGMSIHEEMPALGAITGSIDEERVAEVRKLPGVASASETRRISRR
jgi:hypothetical protein